MLFHLIAPFLVFTYIWLSCGKNNGGHRAITKPKKSDKKVGDKTTEEKGPKGSKKKSEAKKRQERQEDETSSPGGSCSKSSRKAAKKKGSRPLGTKRKTEKAPAKAVSKPKSRPKTPKPLDNMNINKKPDSTADEHRDLPPVKRGPSFDSLIRNIEKQRAKPKEDDESTDLRTPSWIKEPRSKSKLEKNPTGGMVNELQTPANPPKSPKKPKVEAESKPAGEPEVKNPGEPEAKTPPEPEVKTPREPSIKEYTARSYKEPPEPALVDNLDTGSCYFPIEAKKKEVGHWKLD
ncbi:unnamed protein product [Bursaphelenchus xylophilus]|uniref:(pine wood nematode) hypothetical protein n=1 Tax=Bursaphelenchus xylophilus TaxID=6326 RepID=A0A1I7RVN1_BURXY|nr:unnamed protein product [Bursaphelenchus xylophilus]CAG9081909.1 unnamed protein product [Bursaphelenchus xylophilus]